MVAIEKLRNGGAIGLTGLEEAERLDRSEYVVEIVPPVLFHRIVAQHFNDVLLSGAQVDMPCQQAQGRQQMTGGAETTCIVCRLHERRAGTRSAG